MTKLHEGRHVVLWKGSKRGKNTTRLKGEIKKDRDKRVGDARVVRTVLVPWLRAG